MFDATAAGLPSSGLCEISPQDIAEALRLDRPPRKHKHSVAFARALGKVAEDVRSHGATFAKNPA